ncbi:MAG: hypothetical protein AAGG09_21745 [Pseudomonadota bacterium]
MDSYYDLGTYTRPITTGCDTAREWARRGLIWVYGFHHEEAVACFDRALETDPACPLALWGRAYALGPNYNYSWELMDPKSRAKTLSKCHAATVAACAARKGASPAEQALINALPHRFPQADLPENIEALTAWNVAFADAMRAAQAAHPDDRDLRAIYAEALLNITPWQMWDLASGGPAAGARTLEAQQVLEDAFETDADAWAHPGLLHLYIHLMEMSPAPERALRQADALRGLVPDAGHLLHMASHIDVLCGDYPAVISANMAAMRADRREYDRSGGSNFYTLYRIHDYHFIIYGALFAGQLAPALAANREIHDTVPADLLRVETPPMADFLEPFLSFEPHILIRFGKWQEILALPFPDEPDLHCTWIATLHYAKGVAHAALGQVAEAEAEQERFRAARARVPDSRLLHNNTMQDLFAIADAMLAGEIEYRKGAYDTAFEHLRRSVALDDSLPYDEPWGWMQPTRHALGALLFEQGRVEDAEDVYRQDLGLVSSAGPALPRVQIHPDNVWAMRGLYQCLTARGQSGEAAMLKRRLDVVEARADAPVRASCFCAQAAMS